MSGGFMKLNRGIIFFAILGLVFVVGLVALVAAVCTEKPETGTEDANDAIVGTWKIINLDRSLGASYSFDGAQWTFKGSGGNMVSYGCTKFPASVHTFGGSFDTTVYKLDYSSWGFCPYMNTGMLAMCSYNGYFWEAGATLQKVA
jgi:hypothetical protein